MADAITGKTARRQARLAEAAQADARQRQAEAEAQLFAVEAGQRRVRTGGRSLLAFIDENLRQTFGGT